MTASALPNHHPNEELLLAYAAGSLHEGMALALAGHLSFCPHCRAEVARLEALGGALLEELPASALDEDALGRVLARLEEPSHDPIPLPRRPHAGPAPLLPEPLRRHIGGDLAALGWRRVIPGLQEAAIACNGAARAWMMRIGGGKSMPRHTHRGNELTLVLAGGFSDATGHFRRGDLAVTDAGIDHRPVADADGDCLCLAVTDAPLRLTGRFLRLLNPLLRL